MSQIIPTEVQVKTAMETSRAWVKSLDRSIIGMFAVDEELLAIRYAYEFVNRNSTYFPQLVTDVLSEMVTARCNVLNIPVYQWDDISGEFIFWWKRGDVPSEWMADYFDRLRTIRENPSFQHLTMLDKVANFTTVYPAMLPYLESDIWDEILIHRFINEGIDPVIAVTLNRNVA